MSVIYKAVTPYGAFQAEWGDDEDSRVVYSGSPDAIEFFRAYLDLNVVTGRGGAIVQFDKLEPADLYGFCQSKEYGISVIPNEDDLLDEMEENNMSATSVFDAVGSVESFELIGETAQIFTHWDTKSPKFFDDLDRLRAIMAALGWDTPAVDDPNAEARTYLQAVIDGTVDLTDLAVADELGKIHTASADDADMLALFKSAVQAYADYAIAQAAVALAKG
jgi:hypothetical protein